MKIYNENNRATFSILYILFRAENNRATFSIYKQISLIKNISKLVPSIMSSIELLFLIKHILEHDVVFELYYMHACSAHIDKWVYPRFEFRAKRYMGANLNNVIGGTECTKFLQYPLP